MDTNQIIKKLRREKNFTQEYVAEQLGVTKAFPYFKLKIYFA